MKSDFFIYGNKKYFNKVEDIIAFNQNEIDIAFEKIEKLKQKYYLIGYISYQAKDYFLNKNVISKTPLLFFGVFKDCIDFKMKKSDKERNIYIKENISKAEYFCSVKKIKEQIAKGATYEVNYTFQNEIFCDISGFDLFNSLLENQKTPYCAYIKNDYDEILSFSPELFFEIKDNIITTKPMKGTLKRGNNPKKEALFLKNDIKNRAENAMIVDLMRNDLSKIKDSYDIKTTKLFEVETHKTLHQMTSTVQAKLNKIDLKNILSCLFPSGSITGAPKISTINIIDNIENYKRNIYCGLIGLIYKDYVNFSIPIRILEKKTKNKTYKFSQGGAIVRRSSTKEEYGECETKRCFLGNSVDFDLIETILIQDNVPQLYFEHLKRLQNSAKTFGFKFNPALYDLKFKNDKIARIVLSKNGDYDIQYRDFLSFANRKIKINSEKINSSNSFLYYKTTLRPWYDKLKDEIKKENLFDILFLNEFDELTEGSRSNLVILKDGLMYTPSIACGLLNGVLREKLLKENKLIEKKLYIEDLFSADKIFMINSVRGFIEVRL